MASGDLRPLLKTTPAPRNLHIPRDHQHAFNHGCEDYTRIPGQEFILCKHRLSDGSAYAQKGICCLSRYKITESYLSKSRDFVKTRDEIRVVQIGFNLCGTRSMTTFFQNNGFKVLHWESGAIARRIYYNLQNRRTLLTDIDAHVLTDMEWLAAPHFYFEPYKLFPLLHRQYPNAYFVLNHRPRDEWIESRLNHFEGDYANRMMQTLKIPSQEKLITHWENDWDIHINSVREFFSGVDAKYFEFDLLKDGVEIFQKNIDFTFENMAWPHVRGRKGW